MCIRDRIKTLLVRYRRWGLTTIVLLLPIIYNLLLHIISHNTNVDGTFEMKTSSLNPQTILYKVDSVMENYFQACLLYTSDAADERSSVDLGGRRIIKKNNKKKKN